VSTQERGKQSGRSRRKAGRSLIPAIAPRDGIEARAALRVTALTLAGAGCIIFPEAEAELLRMWREYHAEQGAPASLAVPGRVLAYGVRRAALAPPHLFIPAEAIYGLSEEPALLAALDDGLRQAARKLLRRKSHAAVLMVRIGGAVRMLDSQARQRAPRSVRRPELAAL
jgi:hypothetical protein